MDDLPDTLVDTAGSRPRRVFELEETGFDEVPMRFRRLYRHWRGPGDKLAPNEVLCPVCKIVIRSRLELRVGDRVHCMPCMSYLEIVEDNGMLIGRAIH